MLSRASIKFLAILALSFALVGVFIARAAPQTTQTFTVTNTADSGNGSLRAALISAASSTADTVYVDFNIPGPGPYTIQVLSQLPNVASGTVIDGISQPNADCSTWPPTLQIILDGTNQSVSTPGLYLLGSDVVQGLVIEKFTSGITADGGNNFIQCNYLGAGATGTASAPNGYGLRLVSDNNVVGGIIASTRNLISGNSLDGIQITSGASNNTISGNYIGTKADGLAPLPNAGSGVLIDNGRDNQVGGLLSGQVNTIQSNLGAGITVKQSGSAVTQGNHFYHNSLAYNSGLGIDLGAGGVTLNDPKDPDTGPNMLQNYPWINNVIHVGTKHLISGFLDSLPSTTFHIELFRNPACDPYGYGEGYAYIDSLAVTTDASGLASFAIFSNIPVSAAMTATATDTGATGNGVATSEFSACRADLSGSLTYLPLVHR
jgi:hypothetical protein